MNRRTRILTLGIGSVILAASLVLPLAAWAQSSASPSTSAPIYTNVLIPGSPVEVAANGFVRGKVADIAQYIGLIYNFLIGTIGVVAGVMIMVGGFTYLTAGGDKSKVDSAKKQITNAIAGIIIAFTAYLLLNTINPDLVNLKTPRVATITKETVPFGGYQPVVAPSHLCSTDADCTSLGKGYKCFHNLPSGPGKTADGQCALEQQNAPANAVCTADSQCAKGKCLKSSSSSDSGYCSVGSEGDICFSDDNCAAPRHCIAAGGGYSYCSMGLKGSFCSDSLLSGSNCITADLVCKSVGGVSRCASAAGAGEGEPCAQNTDCTNSNLSSGDESASKPLMNCLKPDGGNNPSCNTGGDYAKLGQLCFCHAVLPRAAQTAGTHCFKDGDCDNTASPALTCKNKTSPMGSGVCG